MAVLLVVLAATTGWFGYVAMATPSPTISRIITPGNIGPCTWFVSLDGTTPVARAMVSGLSVGVGDNVVGTVGQDTGTFLTSIVGANQVYCFSAQTFNFQSTFTMKVGDALEGMGSNDAFIEVLDQPTTNFKWTGASSVGVQTDTTGNWFGRIENINFDCNYQVTTCVKIVSSQGGIFRSINVVHANSVGFLLTTSVSLSNSDMNLFDKVAVHDTTLTALELNGVDASHVVTLNAFIDCRFFSNNGGTSLKLTQNADTNKFVATYIEAPTPAAGVAGRGIVFNAASNATDNNVYENIFDSGALDSTGASAVGILSGPNTHTGQPNIFFGVTFGGTWGTQLALNGQPYIYLTFNPIFNPLGLTGTPFASTLQPTMGPGGSTAAPVASTNYVVNGDNFYVTSTGGTGVSISIKDASSNVEASGLATLTREYVPFGYIINFGAFSVAPTVTIYGQ